jgi:uncharacterized protein (TIGR02453 family)
MAARMFVGLNCSIFIANQTAMISKTTLSFLRDLKKNNHKAWFDEHRERYAKERNSFIEFTADMLKKIAAFDRTVAELEASRCIFRINRDVRFSKDKSPYKSHFAFSITRGGKRTPFAGYYLHLEPGSVFAGGGIYAPEPAVLKAIRDEIYFCFPEFQQILKEKSFQKQFGGLSELEKLKTSPKGYEAGNPALPYLANKHFVVTTSFSDAEVTGAAFGEQLENIFRIQKPFIDFLNRAIENTRES